MELNCLILKILQIKGELIKVKIKVSDWLHLLPKQKQILLQKVRDNHAKN